MSNHLWSVLTSSPQARSETPLLATASGQELSYSDWDRQTARFANALYTIGVRPGDRVAIQVGKSVEALLLSFAIIRAGAVLLPLNPAYTAREVLYFVGDAEPAILIGAPERRSELVSALEEIGGVRLETLGMQGEGSLMEYAASAPVAFHDVNRASDDLAAILYTSGTTGAAKGAMLSHGNLGSNALTLVKTWRFTEQDRLLHALPIFHTHGLFTAVNTILAAGASLLFLPAFDANEVLRLLPKVTSMMGVPTFYGRMLAHGGLTGAATRHMRLFISGSAPLPAEVHAAFQARTGHAILERFGMTETSMNTSNPFAGARRAGSVGPPLEGVEIRITDLETGEPVQPGRVGMIEIRGPNVFKGYWRKPEKTRESFRDGDFFISGDVGKFDTDGYLHIVGREKDLIISGGLNVYPGEVETLIDAFPGVTESAVVGVPHDDFGEGVLAIVVAKVNAQLTEDDIKGNLTENLAGYKIPKRVIFAEALPRNVMGKIQKSVLRQQYKDIFQQGRA